jgi:hypothetical protein
VQKVKGALMFVVCNAFPKASYTVEQEGVLWQKWIRAHEKLKMSYHNDVWNPRPSGLCRKHCVVLECSHNGRS